ncbi:hypothetical protein [Nitrosomonas ureae]|uniref:Nucleotide modification associated domain-containing protein n=1 Tax=Nitrosomonas ureae TaxID=44577 RepID=A0A1H2HVE3_9PROT|nr:hypothetical protein [Nitrosomonas ureae]ALQ50478.1 hypothetical protein ATY38_04050 [Nitrosomonas ureae]SDU35872.1 hypothetical protein SAMN05216406_1683 [Nitrosomonas ureae]
MLIETNSNLYTYVITRDLGFAPNPFHGLCTLATCKPGIRKAAKVGDWILGIGGAELKSVKRKCIFLMKVSEKISFQDYWDNFNYNLKKPVRNGSQVQMLGDNIYHRDKSDEWLQEDSHHSKPDGTPNFENLVRDTGRCDQMLISNYFFYFGSEAINVDLDSIVFGNVRNFKKTILSDSVKGRELINSIFQKNKNRRNLIISDPYHFMDSHKRVDQRSGKLSE